MEELFHLRYLDLQFGDLHALPASLCQLPNLQILSLKGNPDLGLPQELIESGDAPKILDYYFRLRGPGTALPLGEFKLVLVGRGGVGKTTLVHKLVTDGYKQFAQTPGIQITQWPLEVDGEPARAHVWDFGGQEILHGTHRFFMTERALYLVLVSGREGNADTDVDYWLSLVRSFAGKAPVIVLRHRRDECPFELSTKELQRRYGGDQGELVFLETSSLNAHNIPALRDEIKRLTTTLPGLQALWPTAWRRVKDELPAAQKSLLSFPEFCAYAAERGVSEPADQQALADSLHDLGLMLFYRNDPVLRDFGVLNPQWATQGIYQILNAPQVRAERGEFSLATLAAVLIQELAALYPISLHPYLLALMRKFKLCLPLDEDGHRYLIPELLTKEEPDLDAAFPPATCLGFRYRYDSVLPEGLLPRFIVETYVHREPVNTWRRGVVLQRSGCRALVRGDVQGRTISIWVNGPPTVRRCELLAVIRDNFERIHRGFKELPVTTLVPLPEYPGVDVEFEELLSLEATGTPEINVRIGPGLRDRRSFSVRSLLDGVDLPGAPRHREQERNDIPGRRSGCLSLFISYAEADSAFFDQLQQHLVLYVRRGELEVWGRAQVLAGDDQAARTQSQLAGADVVVPLLTASYLKDDRCIKEELEPALARQQRGAAAVVPVIVRACDYKRSPVGKLQPIRPGGKSIVQGRDRDAAWQEVIENLDRVIQDRKRASQGPSQSHAG